MSFAASGKNATSSAIGSKFGETSVSPVHVDQHWRQRLMKETTAKADWNASYGYMMDEYHGVAPSTPSKKMASTMRKSPAKYYCVDETTSIDDLNRTLSTMSPTYKYLNSPSKPSSRSGRSTPTSFVARSGSRPTSRPGSKTGRFSPSKTKTLSLKSTQELLPKLVQTIGCSQQTQGVDPCDKYAAPQTTSHTYGWYRQSLESFGVAEFSKKSQLKGPSFQDNGALN